MKKKELISKLAKIKLFVSDVDGVLTDGGLYYNDNGLIMKKFNVKDGMAVRLLKEAGVETAIISTDISNIIEARAKRLKIKYLYTGSWDKEEKLKQICNDLKISAKNSAFIGDDVNDIGIINYAGVSACPADAANEIIKMVDYVCTKKGGEGVFREFTDLIIAAKNKV